MLMILWIVWFKLTFYLHTDYIDFLFTGDKINNLLNELWREIMANLGPYICESLANAVVENLTVFLDQVSFDEMMPEKL